ncbi:MAG: hypothetical protein H0W86_06705 [Armatimonadetes bacterium]|nr:hypothetical protein [Armatimonadota bacterium]
MITLVFDAPGVTAAQYEEVCRLSNCSQSNVPNGLIFHSASPTDTGWLVVDVWDSEEKFKAFGERLGPAMEKAGITQQPSIYKTHAIINGPVPASV